MMEMLRGRKDVGVFNVSQMGRQGRRAVVKNKGKLLVPRCSSPVTVYVELPSIIEQAFSTIAWDDVEDSISVVRQGSQVNTSEAGEEDFGGYALDFIAESPATLESSLSTAELVPFQGCLIPPLTPDRDFSGEDRVFHSATETSDHGAAWRGVAEGHQSALGHSIAVNQQLRNTLHRRQEETDSLEGTNFHLMQLASRAKHLASVLEKLMTVRDSDVGEPVTSCSVKPSLSPCKRQRLDEGYETESSDSVEDMLRDVSTRCNAVLHGGAKWTRIQRDSEPIRMYGAFSGIERCIMKDSGVTCEGGGGGGETGETMSSFRTSIREHCTIRTQAFPHGHAFTSATQQGGYRFRWVPNQS